jgi:hypothetical protein
MPLPRIALAPACVATLVLAGSGAQDHGSSRTAEVASADPSIPSPELVGGRVRDDDSSVPDGLTAGDWRSIRETYEAERHAVYPVEDGYRARNPGQQWVTRFDGCGFTTTPDAGGWRWGLELQSYGLSGAERRLEGRARTRAEGSRVTYEWDEALEEWFVNERRGLEHGYTVRERPRAAAGTEGPLDFTLTVRGDLRPEVLEDGRGARFLDHSGASVLTYAGLAVMDADGRDLPARLEPAAEGLRILVDERGARYPLTIDPIAQQAYLKASSTGVDDEFGYSVSVSGDTVVVGAQREDSSATGVNGDRPGSLAWLLGARRLAFRPRPALEGVLLLDPQSTLVLGRLAPALGGSVRWPLGPLPAGAPLYLQGLVLADGRVHTSNVEPQALKRQTHGSASRTSSQEGR